MKCSQEEEGKQDFNFTFNFIYNLHAELHQAKKIRVKKRVKRTLLQRSLPHQKRLDPLLRIKKRLRMVHQRPLNQSKSLLLLLLLQLKRLALI
jgi:hypothetical protein